MVFIRKCLFLSDQYAWAAIRKYFFPYHNVNSIQAMYFRGFQTFRLLHDSCINCSPQYLLDICQGIASFYSAIHLMQHKIAFSYSLYCVFFSILIFKNKFPFSQTYTYFHVIRRLRSKLLNRIGRVLSKPKWR